MRGDGRNQGTAGVMFPTFLTHCLLRRKVSQNEQSPDAKPSPLSWVNRDLTAVVKVKE